MSDNARLAEALSLIGKLLELTGADSFRASANTRAGRTVEAWPADITAVAREQGKEALMQIEGIGPKLADKIVEYAKTGKINELEELKAAVPAGLLEIMQVPGLGPKTVRLMWTDAGVTDLAGLKRIIADGSILSLPRMGEKAVEKIKSSLALFAQAGQRLRLGPAQVMADRIVERLSAIKGVKQVAFAGSLRRGRETVGDLDILLATDDEAAAAKATESFCTMPGVLGILARGDSKASLQLRVDVQSRWDSADSDTDKTPASPPAGPTVQVDLRIIPSASFGAALMYFTGSKEHNVKMRQRALDRGLTLNEYGLFPEDTTTDEPPQKRGVKPLAAKTEPDVYAALGMNWVPPEMREDRGEMEAFSLEDGSLHEDAKGAKKKGKGKKTEDESPAEKTGKGKLGKDNEQAAHVPFDVATLVTVESIKSELHAHTTASDGVMSIVQLAQEAKRRGLHTIAVTDHSKSSAIAGGLSPDRLREHIKAIHTARKEVDGITILAGSEVDILSDGSLDYDDELLAQLDVVVASPHAALTQDSATATKRLLKAITHPLVHILGHPTGRLVLRRQGLEPDMAALIAAAKEHNVALEINAHWMRLDLRDTHVRQAMNAGCLLAIDTDAHEGDDFDNLRFGVMTARRGWLTQEACINTWPAKRLHAWLKAKGR